MDWLTALFAGGAALGGAYLTSQANKKAAELAAQASDRNTQAIRAGQQQATQRLDTQVAQAQPGTEYLRSLVANPPQIITPSQQLQLEDTRRQANNVLSHSGMRGSGRAVTASIRKVEADTKGNFYDQNQRRADTAGAILAGQAQGANQQAANVDMNAGTQVGQGAIAAGNTAANAGTATAASNASTLGAIASIFANDAKEQQREKRYKEVATGQ